MNEEALDKARASIKAICTQFSVQLTDASGPAFDKKLLRMLNADHVH